MLSKNNQGLQQQKLAAQRQHFGLRKLNIGVASVLLGASLIWWAGAKPVQAATDSAQNQPVTSTTATPNPAIKNTVELSKDTDSISDKSVNPAVPTQATTVSLTDQSSHQSAPTAGEPQGKQGNAATPTTPTDTAKNGEVDQPAPSVTTQHEDTKPTVPVTNKDSAAPTSLVAPDSEVKELVSDDPIKSLGTTNLMAKLTDQQTNPVVVTPTADNPLQVTLSDGTSVTISRDAMGAVDNPGNMTVTLQIPNYHPGEQVTLTLPGGYFGVDRNQIEGQSILPATGTTKVDYPSDGSVVITDTFTATGTGGVTQSFTIYAGNNYGSEPVPMTELGTVIKTITVVKKDSSGAVTGQGQVTFKQVTVPKMEPSFGLTRPNTSLGTPLMTNTEYIYSVNVNESNGIENNNKDASSRVDSAVNFGTTITVPVPKGFVLDLAATKTANNFQDATTIEQPGGDGTNIIITVPQGSGSQGWQSQPGYQLVGSYQVSQPTETTTITADAPITVDQLIKNADGTSYHLEKDAGTWTAVLRGTDSHDSYPQLSVDGWAYSHIGQLPLTIDQSIPLLTVNLRNPTPSNITNAQVTAEIPDGLAINRVVTPVNSKTMPGTTSYAWKATLMDGSVVSGTVSAGGVVTTNGPIQSISFSPNVLMIGADTVGNGFRFFGNVSKTHSDGTPLRYGDKLVAKIDASYQAPVAGVMTKVTGGTVISQTITQAKATVEGAASSTHGDGAPIGKPGEEEVGVFALNFGSQTSTINFIYEPVFYYVLAEGFYWNYDTADPTAGISNLNGGVKPKVSTYMVNGREVVKLDYTGTKYNFDTTQYSDAISLSISPLAKPGSFPAAVYIYSPTTALVEAPASEDAKEYAPELSSDQLKNLYGTHISYAHDNWTVSLPKQTGTLTGGQGNQNPVSVNHGTSDDKGTAAMNFQTDVYNADAQPMTDSVLVINVDQGPDANGLDFQLTGPVTGTTAGEEVLYSTTPAPAAGTARGEQPDLTGYVTADQVTNWSAVKAVAIKIGTIGANTISPVYTLVGQDLNVAQDAGKSTGLTTTLYSQEYSPLVATAANNATIKVTGNSTVTAKVVVDDGSGQSVDLTDLTHSYQDNVDTIEQSDFKPTDSDMTTINNLVDQLNKANPNYVYSFSADQTPDITAGAKSWQTDAPAGTPAFGTVAKYYDNNATVVYHITRVGAKKTATISYVDDTTGKTLLTAMATGAFDQPIQFTTSPTDQISNYNKMGYELVSNDFTGQKYGAGKNDFTVHLKERVVDVDSTMIPVEGQPVPGVPGVVWTSTAPDGWLKDLCTTTASLTVNFKDLATDQTLAPTVTQKWTYTQTGKLNLVTLQFTGNENWTTTDPAYKPVTIPTIKGMVPSYTSISYTPQPGYDKEITVYYSPDPTESLPDDTKTVTRTITVKDPVTGEVTTTTQTANFHRTATKDLVTGDISYGEWNTDQKWDAFTTPTIAGYTPSQTSVAGKDVTANDTDQTVNIDYTANDQTASLTIIDDTTGQILATDSASGKFGQAISFPDLAGQLAKYEKGGYVCVSNSLDGQTYQADNAKNAFTVHLKHGMQDVTATDPDATKTVTRTINVTDPVTGEVTTTTQTASFHRTATKDLVTGEISYGDWNTDQKWDAFTTPTIDGYTPTVKSVPEQPVTATDSDATVNIEYTANDESVNVIFRDSATGQDILTTPVTGKMGSTVDLLIKTTIPTGWVLDGTDPRTADYKLGATNPDVIVKIKHGTQALPDETKTVTRTINVKNPVTGEVTTTTQTANFHRTATKDLVTGEISYGGWNTDQKWAKYTVPTVAGYTPSQAAVAEQAVSATDQDVTVNITYTANEESVKVIFEDSEGTVISEQTIGGKTGQVVNTKDQTSVPDGWVIDGTDPRGEVTLTANTPDVIVHVMHGLTTSTEAKTVTRTIVVNLPDGTKKTIPQTATFTRTVIEDLVTGAMTFGKWSADQTWAAFTPDQIAGYVATPASVPAQTVTPDTADTTVTITYAPVGGSSETPSGAPSQAPSEGSSATPSQGGSSATPSQAPSEGGSSAGPSQAPSEGSSAAPSQAPSEGSSSAIPSQAPSEVPSATPSQAPSTGDSSAAPSQAPSEGSSVVPSATPSQTPEMGTSTSPAGLTKPVTAKAPTAVQKRLPQTGNADRKATAIAGLALMGVVASLLGMGKKRKHEN